MHNMKVLKLFAASLAVAACYADASDFTVRASANGRRWQVDRSPSEPIVWVWPDSATAATLTVTSHVGKTSVATYSFTRADGADTGSWMLPAASGERLYDLALEIVAGEKVVESLYGRVVILPETIDVIPTNSTAWSAVIDRSPRPVPYDAAWSTNDDVAAAALTLSRPGGEPAAVALQDVSGFEPFDLTPRLGEFDGPFAAALAFDGDDALYTAQLRRIIAGVVISIR